MSQSLANIVVHLVFTTKGRRPLLRDEERGELHAYITGILKNLDSPLIEINSVRDHVHILFAQSKKHAPAKIIEQVKSSSSAWLKKQHDWYSDFAWQTGYGEFSVRLAQRTSNPCANAFATNRNTTNKRISKRSIGGFARRMAGHWMNDMRGIEFGRPSWGLALFRPYRAPTGCVPFATLTGGVASLNPRLPSGIASRCTSTSW